MSYTDVSSTQLCSDVVPNMMLRGVTEIAGYRMLECILAIYTVIVSIIAVIY